MRYFLIGFMGVGKSTQGRILAEKIGEPFIDLDAEIEQRERRTISDIFGQDGESYFREREREVLFNVTKQYISGIFATGGGMPCFPNAMEDLNALGTTIYLQADAESLSRRLTLSKGKRPLVAQKSMHELQEFVSSKLQERSKFYEKAKYIVSIDLDQSASFNADQILRILSV